MMTRYPTTVPCEEHIVTLRLMTDGDETGVLEFAKGLPVHDLLSMRRDITNSKVVAAWARAINNNTVQTVLAMDDNRIVGCGALIRDPLSWSPHYGELRVLVSPSMRQKGLGRVLIQECFLIAIEQDLKKLSAHMTTDQKGAVAIFEELGFRGEALLHDQVMDKAGETHDIVILSCDVERIHKQMIAYGINDIL